MRAVSVITDFIRGNIKAIETTTLMVEFIQMFASLLIQYPILGISYSSK